MMHDLAERKQTSLKYIASGRSTTEGRTMNTTLNTLFTSPYPFIFHFDVYHPAPAFADQPPSIVRFTS